MPQDTGAQAAQADDAVSRVLRSNADDFEKKDVMTMAICGFIIACLSLFWAWLFYFTVDEGQVLGLMQLVHALVMAGLAVFTIKQVKLAGTMLFALVAAALASNFISGLFAEQVSYLGLGITLVVALFVLGKMYPGLGSLKVLADKAEHSGSTNVVTMVLAGIAGLLILEMAYLTVMVILA
ncbi:hypothetical protein [Kordiimonas lacus]|uniref:Uncharacterized protein n=1 Tax=Kordiimonas lacus TaxID=637679 RepID=A0A1G6T7Y9_9PROT|nr:hypothetical protein [Kordiimonas lacus]SDD24994.1 hypothetical protein SAMN04488071_0144 [Kordiimonas lacus]